MQTSFRSTGVRGRQDFNSYFFPILPNQTPKTRRTGLVLNSGLVLVDSQGFDDVNSFWESAIGEVYTSFIAEAVPQILC